MADIFEIKGVNIELKIKDRTFKFVDPNFRQKVLLQKKFEALKKETAGEDQLEYLMKAFDLTKESIKQYLPDMDDSYLDSLGDNAMQALLSKIKELSDTNFGAVVEKVEGKSEATL